LPTGINAPQPLDAPSPGYVPGRSGLVPGSATGWATPNGGPAGGSAVGIGSGAPLTGRAVGVGTGASLTGGAAWQPPATSAAGSGDQSWRDQPAFGSAAGVGDMSWKTQPASGSAVGTWGPDGPPAFGSAAGVGSGASLTGGAAWQRPVPNGSAVGVGDRSPRAPAGVAPQDMQRLMMQANARGDALTAGGTLPQNAPDVDHFLFNRGGGFSPELIAAASQPGFNPRNVKGLGFKEMMLLHELQNQQNGQR
jgi:hypothetical protein